MDWDAFEAAWHDVGCRTLTDLAAAHPGERLYAAAFHLFYGDSTQILTPALAANTEAAVHANFGYSTRFDPPDWRWDVLDGHSDAMQPWYQRLTDEAVASAGEVTDEVWVAHDGAMARVCRALTATARGGGIHDSLPSGFVVVILEGQREPAEGAALIRASVDPEVLASVPDLVEHVRELERA